MMKIVMLVRFAWAGWVLVREGVLTFSGGGWFFGLIARKRSFSRSERMSCAMNRLGPSYVKLGQFLATRPDIIGRDAAEDLALLQDRMKTFSWKVAVSQIEASLGRNIKDIFYCFEEPVAAASVAQVHPAWVRHEDGSMRRVAVKVIRPGVRRAFARDIKSFFFAAELAERYLISLRRLSLVRIVKNLQKIVRMEMDLRFEAAAISEMAENITGDVGFRVPKVYWECTGRDVLTMEWVDGIKISDRDGLIAAGYDPCKLAVSLIQSFLRHTLRDGFFHADMHSGNLFVDKDGVIVAVDFGITGRLGQKEQRFLAEILFGFIHRDYKRVAEVHFAAGYVSDNYDVATFAQANRAIGEPIHGHSVEGISMARLLSLLFEVTDIFDMQARPELLLLQKTMVVVEGVARSLDPNFNMWKAAEPVVSEWISKNIGPVRFIRDIFEGSQDLIQAFRKKSESFDVFYGDGKKDRVLHSGFYSSNDAFHKKLVFDSRCALWIIAFCCLVIVFKFVLFPFVRI